MVPIAKRRRRIGAGVLIAVFVAIVA